MNKTTKKFRSLLILILALVTAFSSFMTVACKKKGNSSSTEETEETTTITERTDYQTLKNGDFEFGTANTALTAYPASPSGWSKSYDSIGSSNATTSSYGSGIIDTREYKYEYDEDGYVLLDEEGNPVLAKDKDGNYIKVFDSIASSNAFPKYAYEYTTTTVDGKEERIYTKDGNDNFIPKMDADGNPVEADSVDTEFYYYNPGTPFDNGYIAEADYSTSEKTNISKGGKILMIHNKVVADEGKGTAQYYKSSTTLTLGVGENGLIEAWVLTKDLTSKMNTDFGAYVSVASTVGAISAGDVVVKNINTYGNWSKVQVYVEGSAFAETTLTVTLGLGFGSSSYKYEFVEGFAFFDNVHFKTVKSNELPADESADVDSVVSLYSATKELITDDVNYSFAHTKADFDALTEDAFITTTLKINAKKELSNFTVSGTSKAENVYESISSGSNFNVGATAQMVGNELKFNYPNNSTLSFETTAYSLAYEENIRISFLVKTELVNVTNATNGLTIYLMDKGLDGSSVGTEVALLSDFKTTKGENADNDDFTLVSVIVSNTYSDATRYFSLKFVLGATENADYLEALPKGSATIKEFKTITLSDEEVANLSTSDENHITKRTLQGEYSTLPSDDTSNDSYAFSYGLPSKQDITHKAVVDVQNYTHLVGGTAITGGSKDLDYKHPTDKAGLINSKYIDNYGDDLFTVGSTNYKAQIKTWLETVAAASDNEYAQPLMINNENATFGYIGSSLTLSASTTYLITVKVKIFGDATAYIYLSDMDSSSNAILSVDAKENTHTNQTITAGQYGYAIALTAKDVNANETNGFATVQFLITTGKHDSTARNYRIEMWNGSRDGAANSNGIVFFDGVTTPTTSTDRQVNLRDLKYTYTTEKAYKEGADGYDYTYATAESNKVTFTQLPTLIKTDANPDGVLTNYETSDLDHTSVIFMTNGTLENGIVKGGTFIVSDLTAVDADLEVDNTTKKDESSSGDTTTTTTTESTSYSPFLFATSLIVSVALIIALIAVLVKHIITKRRNKKLDRENYYDTSAREKAHEKILSKKTATEEDKKDYDYDNPENNVDFTESETAEDIQAENEQVAEEIETVLSGEESVEVESEESVATDATVENSDSVEVTEESSSATTETTESTDDSSN